MKKKVSETSLRVCPVCGLKQKSLISKFSASDKLLLETIQNEKPGWIEKEGICSRCVDEMYILAMQRYSQMKKKFQISFPQPSPVLPTGIRLNALESLDGEGIGICLIDSGFYLHPDLTEKVNRILHIADLTEPDRDWDWEYFKKPHQSAWHGTMTSVVCAGNGTLSGGFYKGIAHRAKLVLLKVADEQGHISGENIAKAIRWAVEHREKYNLRVINLSVTDDSVQSYKESQLAQACQLAFEKGIVVVAAAGNDPNSALKAPANSPHVITVGGLDDRNTLNPFQNTLYHSTYGKTIDGFLKPDLIAPSIWVAAPILPDTKEQQESHLIFSLLQTDDAHLMETVEKAENQLQHFIEWKGVNLNVLRQKLMDWAYERKYIHSNYMHADGTSFAAPIVTSVVAQMLQFAPHLKPSEVRELLLTTARRIHGEEAGRQGYGVIQPAAVLAKIAVGMVKIEDEFSPKVDYSRNCIQFSFDKKEADEVSIAGNFNNWDTQNIQMHRGKNGQWIYQLPLLPKGFYTYKFFVNQRLWFSDPRNVYRENDGFNGFNSILIIE